MNFCVYCGRPMTPSYSERCADCLQEDWDDDADWAGMNIGERCEHIAQLLELGEAFDAVNFLMHDGDVRADSVKTAINLIAHLNITQNKSFFTIIEELTRLITAWETTNP